MKIISSQEKVEHKTHILHQCYKGCVVGAVAGVALISYMKFKQPIKYNTFNWTIKASMIGMPVIGCAAFASLKGSARFFDQHYRADHLSHEKESRVQKLQDLSLSEKMLLKLNEHKYKFIIGAWAGSLYAAWRILNKDLYLSRTQKFIHARVYAQAFALGLLLSSFYLSMKNVEIQKKLPQPLPNWQQALQEQGNL
ncbi:RCF2 Respiratory supercomplex factor 2 [Candida maltosa Xu316]|uniref:HIG1 domain-containing protein n=1 Tax=Candida maltosa (strain Xu316) TaxID=1245528 RepID=M3IRN9_CANMX|nr:hypothetical protein G210_0116 [Candida maltosa Xu316]